jgi:hypothetical protein
MTMALFYLAKPTTGGWPTYTAHLAKGIGSNTTIFKIGKRNETFPRRFGRGLSYQNVTIEQAIAIAATFPSVITATDKHYQEYSHRLISETNCPAVVHDPTELKLAHIETLGPTVVIRESMLHHLPKARFIKHPYMRCPDFGETDQKRAGGVAISRVDYDKRTHMIAEANQIGANISIYGTENRLYTHHKLNNEIPEWREMYKGGFPTGDLWAGARLCRNHESMVDMSVISGDGGGTQYTFLEALDAGAGLILHDEWKPSGLLGEISTTVSTAEELKEAVNTASSPGANAEKLLSEHDAVEIAKEYMELCET